MKGKCKNKGNKHNDLSSNIWLMSNVDQYYITKNIQ